MRNCFVPGCDSYCKKNNCVQRKMFLPPAARINDWKEVLHNKRVLKTHDRVCERHFDEKDIIQYWQANINGQIHLTPRDKPKLRENAIPTLNLPSKEQFESKDGLKRRSMTAKDLSNRLIAPLKRKIKEESEDDTKKAKILEPGEELDVAITRPTISETDQKIKVSTLIKIKTETENKFHKAKLAMFENLYDEAFDVTLPSLLWGIHRDPERKFLAFSEFSHLTRSISKLIQISDNFNCETFVKGKLKSSRTLKVEQLTADHISEILDELDKTSS
jgi:THAP domain